MKRKTTLIVLAILVVLVFIMIAEFFTVMRPFKSGETKVVPIEQAK